MIKKLKNKEDKIYKGFITFVLSTLLLLMVIIVFGSFNELRSEQVNRNYIDFVALIIAVIYFYIIYRLCKRGYPIKKLLISIIAFGFVLRALYAFSIASKPVSDFAIMYKTAGDVLNGDYSQFWGTGYIARFPHITIPTLYYALIRAIFPRPLLVIKFFNVLASSVSIFIIYLLVKELFDNEKKGLISAVIASIFPPLVLYTAVFTTENLAIPLYLLGVYFFVLFTKKNKFKYLMLSGIIISAANLFRMVGQVIIVAFILYIIVSYKDKLKKKLIAILIIISSFLIPLVGASYSLHNSGIIEYQLWKGREPNSTNIVKGLNIEHQGRWNEEDAKIPDKYDFDYEKIDKACKDIIYERLTNTPKLELLNFFKNKYSSQWSVGDFSGSYWAEHDDQDGSMVFMVFKYSEKSIWAGQLLFFILIVLSYIGLLNFREVKNNRSLSLIYYIYCGYSILYLVSENQARYGFIVCWIFILLAMVGIDFIERVIIGRGK